VLEILALLFLQPSIKKFFLQNCTSGSLRKLIIMICFSYLKKLSMKNSSCTIRFLRMEGEWIC